MAEGKKGTANLNTLTRAVASIVRTEDAETSRLAVRSLLRAYDDADDTAGRRCLTAGCRVCGGPDAVESTP